MSIGYFSVFHVDLYVYHIDLLKLTDVSLFVLERQRLSILLPVQVCVDRSSGVAWRYSFFLAEV